MFVRANSWSRVAHCEAQNGLKIVLLCLFRPEFEPNQAPIEYAIEVSKGELARRLALNFDLVVRNLYAAGSGSCSAGAHPAGFSAWLTR